MNWFELNAVLPLRDERQVQKMLEDEVTKHKRTSFIVRLHQRYTTLRAQRERKELLERVEQATRQSAYYSPCRTGGEVMSDIVERLRKWSIFGYGFEASCDMKEAATEIEHQRTAVANAAQALSEQTLILTALRAENEKLRAALGDIHAAAGNNHLIANIARAALEGKQ